MAEDKKNRPTKAFTALFILEEKVFPVLIFPRNKAYFISRRTTSS
jgi:hypothetical protein